MADLGLVKELTFDMNDKTDEKLWGIVREACRITTPAWRAYERLHSRYRIMKLREERQGKHNEASC